MKKILAFGASNSKHSINGKFAKWAVSQLQDSDAEILDLNDFEMPIYSIDREKESGIPDLAVAFKEKIKDADGIIISLAEYNGSYTSAFKNIVDWVSRIEKGIWGNKPMLLLSTSPGPRGGKGVLESAVNSYPHQGAQLAGSFSLPQFQQNFDAENGITDGAHLQQFQKELENFIQAVNEVEISEV